MKPSFSLFLFLLIGATILNKQLEKGIRCPNDNSFLDWVCTFNEGTSALTPLLSFYYHIYVVPVIVYLLLFSCFDNHVPSLIYVVFFYLFKLFDINTNLYLTGYSLLIGFYLEYKDNRILLFLFYFSVKLIRYLSDANPIPLGVPLILY